VKKAAKESERPTPASAPPRGIWTIQLAAYNTRLEADRLVKTLASRGVRARVSGDTKPFRVRLDYYPTRQAAAAEVAALKQRGIIGFVTDEPRPTGATSP
jgi:cell division protein FtsN